MQQSSAKRLEERIRSASAEKNKLEGELMTLQSELKSGKKAKQALESENAKLSGRLHFIDFHYSTHSTLCEHVYYSVTIMNTHCTCTLLAGFFLPRAKRGFFTNAFRHVVLR